MKNIKTIITGTLYTSLVIFIVLGLIVFLTNPHIKADYEYIGDKNIKGENYYFFYDKYYEKITVYEKQLYIFHEEITSFYVYGKDNILNHFKDFLEQQSENKTVEKFKKQLDN